MSKDNTHTHKTNFKQRFFGILGKTALGETKYVKKVNQNLAQEVARPIARKETKSLEKTEKQFSVIIPVYNVKPYLREAIDSVIRQTVDFKKNIQLILIDDGSTDGSEVICGIYAHKYPTNVTFRRTENRGVSAARNLALDLAIGKYIAFLDGDDYLSDNFLDECQKFMEANAGKIDVCFTNHEFFDKRKGRHHSCVNLEKSTIITSSGANDLVCSRVLFFKSEVCKKFKFNEELVICEDADYAARVLREKGAFGYVHGATYFYRQRVSGDSAFDSRGQSNIAFYKTIIQMRNFIEDDLKEFGHVKLYTQRYIVHSLRWFNIKSAEEVLNMPEYAQAYDALIFCLKHIDSNILIKRGGEWWQKMHLLKLKHGNVHIDEKSTELVTYLGDVKIQVGSGVYVKIYEELKGIIHIGGLFTSMWLEKIDLVVRYKNQEYLAKTKPCNFSTRKIYFLGKEIISPQFFDVFIPFGGDGHMEFFWRTKGGRRIACSLFDIIGLNSTKGQVFIGDTTITKRLGLNLFKISELKLETLKLDIEMANRGYLKTHKEFLEEYFRRFHEFNNSRIWIFCDRLTSVEDNGWWLYQYSKNINDGIEKYFLYSSKAKNWAEVSKDPNVLDFENLNDRALLLLCEKFISSHSFKTLFPPRDEEARYAFYSFFRADQIYLQHGVNKDAIGNMFSHYNQNFSMIITSCRREYEFFKGDQFAFPEGRVRLTGLPRFDYLQNNQKKVIVFAPTWNKNISWNDQYNPGFVQTDRYKLIQNFINDKRLYENLSKYGYKLYVKLHQGLTLQRNDFYTEYGDVVEFCDDLTYSRLFEIGSLFITDYSSTFFDFGYLKKPVLYCHVCENHYSNDEEYFSYENDGFGKVSYDLETLIDNIIESIQGGCKMPKMYQKRVDDFFTFRDKNNCKRVYEEILKLPPTPQESTQKSQIKKPNNKRSRK